ncbi:hypothetical protein SELMODRAFT_406416 [Selaginella moellendorffii]|uniref:Uncharacterized protein n=1 Tax=Selaginella moellendorffii TaxID=88036 RepID=D8R2A5_SELML|nr:hypothetical protein SELMODRAFT_406416 [Selaginella moellendorffii]
MKGIRCFGKPVFPPPDILIELVEALSFAQVLLCALHQFLVTGLEILEKLIDIPLIPGSGIDPIASHNPTEAKRQTLGGTDPATAFSTARILSVPSSSSLSRTRSSAAFTQRRRAEKNALEELLSVETCNHILSCPCAVMLEIVAEKPLVEAYHAYDQLLYVPSDQLIGPPVTLAVEPDSSGPSLDIWKLQPAL